MNRGLLVVLVLAALTQHMLHGQVPTVDQVLQRFVSALGGKSELENIRTMTLRGTMDFPDFKASGTTTEYFKYPDLFSAETDVHGHGSTKLVYDGREGWQVDPQNGLTQVTGADLSDIQRRANIHWNLELHEFYPNIQVKSHEMVNGEDAWKLEASLGKSSQNPKRTAQNRSSIAASLSLAKSASLNAVESSGKSCPAPGRVL